MTPESEAIQVEVVYAGPSELRQRRLWVKPGTRVAEAVRASAVLDKLPAAMAAELSYAIFGERVAGNRILESGDRIELLRPLKVDPKEARRRRARPRRSKPLGNAT